MAHDNDFSQSEQASLGFWRLARITVISLLFVVCTGLLILALEMLLEHEMFAFMNGARHLPAHLAAALFAGCAAFLVMFRSAKRQLESKAQANYSARMNARLEERRRLLESIIDALPYPFFYKDRAGRYIGCNNAYADLLGIPREKILDAHATAILPEAFGPEIHKKSDEALLIASGNQSYEIESKMPDGSLRTGLVQKASFNDSNGQVAGIVGSIVEITQQREQVKLFRMAASIVSAMSDYKDYDDTIRRVLRLIRESGVDAVGIRLRSGGDFPFIATDGFDNEFLRQENSLCASDGNVILRDSNGEPILECLCGMVLKGKAQKDAPFMTARGSFWTNAASELTSGQGCLKDFRIRGRCPALGFESIAIIPLKSEGTINGTLQLNYRRRNALTLEKVEFFEGICASVDLAIRRKRTEERLAESEANLQIIFNSMSDGILGTDIETRRFVIVNDSICRMLGYTRKELLGLTFGDVHFSEDIPSVERHFKNALEKKSIRISDIRFMRKDGEALHVGLAVTIMSLRGKQCAVGSFHDISERRRYEAELVRARDTAEAANLAKSRFLANMSHELRTPLNPVIGFADILLEADNLTSEQRTQVGLVKQRAGDLLNLINDILDLSKIEAEKLEFNLEDVGLRHMLSNAAHTVEFTAKTKKLAFSAGVDEEVPDAMHTDPLRVQQVLVNLLGNAVKFTERGEVSCRIVLRRNEPLARRVSSGEVALHVVVRDTGIGIPEDRIKAIFEPFQQGDSSLAKQYGGTGLGLAITRRLVAMMGGQIWAESRPGHGSVFHCTLILLRGQSSVLMEAEAAFRKTALEQSSAAQGGANYKALIVEDDLSSRMLVGGVLRKAGHSVVFAETANDALALLENQEFDVVLMDIQLPGMDGIAATAAIRERDKTRGRHTVIVALTAYAMRGDRERFLDAGMDAYVSKPFDHKELLQVICRTVEKARST